jgi:signal transduction histidine kinase
MIQTAARIPDFSPIPQSSFAPDLADAELSHRERELAQRETLVCSLTARLVQSQEQQQLHLARELHDDIGQRLGLATSEIAILGQEVEAPILKHRLAVVLNDLRALCNDVHLMSHGLHSFKLEYLGLQIALSDLCKRHSRPGFEVTLRADEHENPRSKEVSLCLYRVAQEALSNASKYSDSATVVVTVAKVKQVFFLTIEDMGIGFDKSRIAQGLGLLSMAERVNLVRGQLTLRTALGSGTKIMVRISDKDQPRQTNSA